MKVQDLAQAVGVEIQHLSILKTGKNKAIHFSTLESICKHLQCQPGDIFQCQNDEVS